jgi:hypothetical protein
MDNNILDKLDKLDNDIDAAISKLESLLAGSQKESSGSILVKRIISELELYKNTILVLRLNDEIETNEDEKRKIIEYTKIINKYSNGIDELVDDYNNINIEDNDFTEKYKGYPKIATGKTNQINVIDNKEKDDVFDDEEKTNKDKKAEKIVREIKKKHRDINQLIIDFKKNFPSDTNNLIELQRREQNSFYKNLIEEITVGKYHDKLDKPEQIFDEHIKILKNELFNITGKHLDDINPPEPPESKFKQIDVTIPDSSVTHTNEPPTKPIKLFGINTDDTVIFPQRPPRLVTKSGGVSGGGSGGVSGGGSGPPPKGPKLIDANAVTQELLDFDENNVSNKATAIQNLLVQNKDNLSLMPEIKDRTVTVVSIFKDGEDIKYDAFNVNDVDTSEYTPGKFTYKRQPPRMLGGNTHFKTIRNKHNNHHKTRKSAKKHLSKRKQVKLNKNRKTHHK